MLEFFGLKESGKHEIELINLFKALDNYMWTGNPEKAQEFIEKHDLPNKPMSLVEIMSEYFKKYKLDVKFNKKGKMTILEN